MQLRPLCVTLLCGLGSGLLFSTAFGHGGTYRGPGDTVPAGGGGGGGGGGTTPGPSGGNPSGPGSGGPSPAKPGGNGGNSGGPGPRGGQPTTGDTGGDLTNWEYWWTFNKDQFLGLRSALYTSLSTADVFSDEPGRRNTLVPSQAQIRDKVVPALRKALETERQNDIVTGALVALAKIGDVRGEDGRSAFEELFRNWLPDSSQEVAETSAVALGILASDSSVRTLSDLAFDSEAGRKLVRQSSVPVRTRAFAAYGLGLIGARSASNSVRTQIADALCGLLALPGAASPDLCVAAITSFGLTPVDWSANAGLDARSGASSSRKAQIEYLLQYLQAGSNDKLVRAHVPAALAHLLTHEPQLPAEGLALREHVLRSLSELIGEHSRETQIVRQGCVLALGPLTDLDLDEADSVARAELRRVCEHGQLQERAFALIALGQVAGHPGSGNGSLASLNLIRGLLVNKLSGGAANLRPWAALGLGISERELDDLGSSEFAASSDVKIALRSALHGATDELVGGHAVALGIARDSEAAEELLLRLRAVKEPGQQGYVALALGMIGANSCKAEIQQIVREAKYKPELLRQAAIALGLLGDKSLVPDLVTMLAEAKSLASQAAVASALGWIGDARSIDPLLKMLQDKQLTGTARGFAAVALGIVSDKEALPWYAKISVNINYGAGTSTLTTPGGTGLLDIL